MAFCFRLGTVPLPGPFPMRRSLRRPSPALDPLAVALGAVAGSLLLLLGWGVEQWRLSDREVPVHTARLHAYP